MAYKLLLADDSVTIQRVIELTFADEDIDVVAVGDGQQAIDRIEQDPPDIVLADVGMPERDGYDVSAFVKGNPRLARIPVLLLAGAFEPIDQARAAECACDGVLAKPFEPQMVINRVKDLLTGAPPRPGDYARPRVTPAPAADYRAPRGTPVPDIDYPPPPPPRAADVPEIEYTPPPPPRAAVVPEIDYAPPPARKTWEFERVEPGAPGFLPADHAPLDQAASPQIDPDSALTDYFDRLDAAFANLNELQPAGDQMGETFGAPPAHKEPAPARSWPPAHDRRYPVTEPVEAPPAAEADIVDLGDASSFGAAAGAWTPAVESRSPGSDVPPSGAPGSATVGSRPVVADAFSALLAAEQGEAPVPVPRLVAPLAPPPAVVTDDLVREVAQRVLEQVTDRIVRESVADIVSSVAERVVREEIERLKASLR